MNVQSKRQFQLHVVATPIGNMGDITLRALETLKSVDVIACEDTRTSGVLLKHYGISTKTVSYHDHNADDMRPKLLAMMGEGKSIALISDAGTPLISDPGYKLARDAREAGFSVTTLPGASSVMAALTLSTLPSDRFMFVGFLPTTQKSISALLEQVAPVDTTLVVLTTAQKLLKDLKNLHATLGNRRVALVREITKLFEEAVALPAAELIAKIENEGAPKGEMVLVIGAGQQQAATEQDVDALLAARMQMLTLKDAVEEVSKLLGLPKKQVYARALELKP